MIELYCQLIGMKYLYFNSRVKKTIYIYTLNKTIVNFTIYNDFPKMFAMTLHVLKFSNPIEKKVYIYSNPQEFFSSFIFHVLSKSLLLTFSICPVYVYDLILTLSIEKYSN